MKPAQNNPVDSILHEELALRRLKELGEPPAPPPSAPWVWLWPLEALLLSIRGAELVRQVAPGLPPQPRHEWEKQDFHRPNVY